MLGDEDLPALFSAADATSALGQRRYLRATKFRLTMLLVAVIGGAFVYKVGSLELGGAIASVAFITTAILETYFLQARPDEAWYEGRAVAESTKTIAWRYAVGGEPFSIGMPEQQVQESLIQQLRDIGRELGKTTTAAGHIGDQITAKMMQLRQLSLEERRETYRVGRIEDQLSWYSRKSEWNARRANMWSYTMLALEVLGGVGALAKATGLLQIDLLGFAGALIATVSAWVQTKQHQTVAQAYGVAAQELAHIRELIKWQDTEAKWSQFVDDAERAVSREHTMWKASRGFGTG